MTLDTTTAAGAITVRDLHVRIGEVHAVRGIEFTLSAGRTLALVGESGSGKSMTALALMGLNPPGARVTAERLALDDGTAPQNARGDRIAMIFQEPMTALNPVFTIGDQLCAVYRRHRGGSMRAARERAVELLDRVGVPSPQTRLGQYPHMMSGGQRQRVLIAMALMCEPDFLIADEPTTALDVTTQVKLLDLLAGLRDEFGLGMLFITHDLGVVARIADDVAVLKHGEIVETGPCTRVLTAPDHPYTRSLIDSLPQPVPPTAHDGAAPVLSAHGLGRVYPPRGMFGGTPFRALTDASLSLSKGEVLGIVGESGCGKSTLARILIGLDRPTEGRVELGGEDMRNLPQKLRARQIQPVFQDPFGSLNPSWTIRRILDLPLRLHTGLDAAARKAQVLELLKDVGLPARAAEATPRALSGGQRQRVAIARALAAEPHILICDEPTSALDVSVQAQVLELLRGLIRERDLSMVFISHDLAVVQAICDRVIVMDAGRIVEEGATDRLFAAPRHARTQALKDAVLELPDTGTT
ncbi:dipeptide ABC transporter ATP-binding protein [Tropicimonas aquimaris]|uniref:Dipeptide ABC transporter ATP-binding protein n=1 Tax=Tropicimonas aquimaris TaxID=914152 RepID=A0ABW3ILT8_9RHOB